MMHLNIYLFKLIRQFPLDKDNAKYLPLIKIKSYSLVTLKLEMFFVHMTFVTFERLHFASKSDKSVLFRRSLLQRKLQHNSGIQYQFQLFFNGWSVMISFHAPRAHLPQEIFPRFDLTANACESPYIHGWPLSVVQPLDTENLLWKMRTGGVLCKIHTILRIQARSKKWWTI